LLKQQAKGEVILDILHVVDDFERAFSVAEDTDDEFVQGIKLIYNNLTHVLERAGIKEIEALHEPFDPNYHMAIGQVDNPDGKSGTVVEVVQKGYLLDDNVIRPANVIVAK
jgi:molecular chaperone GrpE